MTTANSAAAASTVSSPALALLKDADRELRLESSAGPDYSWYARFDDLDPLSAPLSELIGLRDSAPGKFARAYLTGIVVVRQQLELAADGMRVARSNLPATQFGAATSANDDEAGIPIAAGVRDSDRPRRIQLKRTKGWRMPANTLKVDRATRWGSPYPVSEYGLELSLKLYANTVRGIWNPAVLESRPELIEGAYKRHQTWLAGHSGQHPLEAIKGLQGKNLACWCDLGDSCHVDLMLPLANAETM